MAVEEAVDLKPMIEAEKGGGEWLKTIRAKEVPAPTSATPALTTKLLACSHLAKIRRHGGDESRYKRHISCKQSDGVK